MRIYKMYLGYVLPHPSLASVCRGINAECMSLYQESIAFCLKYTPLIVENDEQTFEKNVRILKQGKERFGVFFTVLDDIPASTLILNSLKTFGGLDLRLNGRKVDHESISGLIIQICKEIINVEEIQIDHLFWGWFHKGKMLHDCQLRKVLELLPKVQKVVVCTEPSFYDKTIDGVRKVLDSLSLDYTENEEIEYSIRGCSCCSTRRIQNEIKLIR